MTFDLFQTPPEPRNTALEDVVTHFMRERARVLEEACERALQGGLCGVRVWTWIDDERLVIMAAAAVDPTVPYGRIYEEEFDVRPPGL